MALTPSQVILYAAEPPDFRIALGAAAIAGIPSENVIGDYNAAWKHVSDGKHLVIAVGAFANSALYYNPCGWANPQGRAGGSTPFAYSLEPQDQLPGKNHFINAAGNLGTDSLKLSAMLAHYAVKGSYPTGYGTNLPHRIAASKQCSKIMDANVPCPC